MNDNELIVKVQRVLEDVYESREYLQTLTGDERECVSVENLEGALIRHLTQLRDLVKQNKEDYGKDT